MQANCRFPFLMWSLEAACYFAALYWGDIGPEESELNVLFASPEHVRDVVAAGLMGGDAGCRDSVKEALLTQGPLTATAIAIDKVFSSQIQALSHESHLLALNTVMTAAVCTSCAHSLSSLPHTSSW